ncbi:MAG: hypothetical protein SAMD01599839_05590 [Rectinema sp.]
MAAPSAVDQRPWEFIVITENAMLGDLAARLPYAKIVAHASAAIIVCGDIRRQWGGPESVMWVIDCAAVAENILLATESMGSVRSEPPSIRTPQSGENRLLTET